MLGEGGPWKRLCCKMASGAGKTTVMAMIIPWQLLNVLTYATWNTGFSRAVLIVGPGRTVKERLQLLRPARAALPTCLSCAHLNRAARS